MALFHGDLSSESLTNAVADAERAGSRPSILVVGTRELEKQALAILGASGYGLDRLRAVMPRVLLDSSIGDGWRLMAIAETETESGEPTKPALFDASAAGAR
jgi:hypothetical protein